MTTKSNTPTHKSRKNKKRRNSRTSKRSHQHEAHKKGKPIKQIECRYVTNERARKWGISAASYAAKLVMYICSRETIEWLFSKLSQAL
jgi:hypothetical protein